MGMWQHDQRNGEGVVVTVDGVYYEGKFVQNKLVVSTPCHGIVINIKGNLKLYSDSRFLLKKIWLKILKQVLYKFCASIFTSGLTFQRIAQRLSQHQLVWSYWLVADPSEWTSFFLNILKIFYWLAKLRVTIKRSKFRLQAFTYIV